MIARVWTARAAHANVAEYAAHLRDKVLPLLKTLPGYRGARLLERDLGAEVEVVVITEWESLDHIRAFAGNDISRAVVADEARRLLTQSDDQVRHYRVVDVDQSR